MRDNVQAGREKLRWTVSIKATREHADGIETRHRRVSIDRSVVVRCNASYLPLVRCPTRSCHNAVSMNSDDKESTLSPTPDHNTAHHDVREDPPLELEDSTENLSIQSKLRTDSAWNSTRWHYGRYALPIFCCSAAFLLHLRARRSYPMVRSRRWTTVALAESYASLAFWWSCHMDMNEFREEAYRDEGLCDLHVYASAHQARRAGAAIIRGHQLDLRIVEGLNGDYSESDVAIDTYPSTDILPKYSQTSAAAISRHTTGMSASRSLPMAWTSSAGLKSTFEIPSIEGRDTYERDHGYVALHRARGLPCCAFRKTANWRVDGRVAEGFFIRLSALPSCPLLSAMVVSEDHN
ncbi:hypothetical protein A0H81_00036 [Grifola frondosa]|uniref:Uncharacterized protein n=1 Tax=Grifola frondosa TaxID=5627 RepID=A0A1C7MR74_GRIFR|nr:hypothetical protein A0H81_00036 [Grifola frondosa]